MWQSKRHKTSLVTSVSITENKHNIFLAFVTTTRLFVLL